jgi:hypothetical protein
MNPTQVIIVVGLGRNFVLQGGLEACNEREQMMADAVRAQHQRVLRDVGDATSAIARVPEVQTGQC